MPSAPKCTAKNAGWHNKAVQEIVRIPIAVKNRGVDKTFQFPERPRIIVLILFCCSLLLGSEHLYDLILLFFYLFLIKRFCMLLMEL